ncbi:hypothetical protein ACFXOY_35445 [Streptomyces niveus]|uniref:hypothetical protein n=1 Tax=Streptomyces niveus TaxID=193462 RepID=UPI00368EF944
MWLLHGAAEGSGPEYREVRRAVAAALPSLLRLAADEDPAVRRAMVWTVAACEDASLPLLPLLRARLAEERDADVRADLVTALGLLDVSPETGGARTRARRTRLSRWPSMASATSSGNDSRYESRCLIEWSSRASSRSSTPAGAAGLPASAFSI